MASPAGGVATTPIAPNKDFGNGPARPASHVNQPRPSQPDQPAQVAILAQDILTQGLGTERADFQQRCHLLCFRMPPSASMTEPAHAVDAPPMNELPMLDVQSVLQPVLEGFLKLKQTAMLGSIFGPIGTLVVDVLSGGKLFSRFQLLCVFGAVLNAVMLHYLRKSKALDRISRSNLKIQ